MRLALLQQADLCEALLDDADLEPTRPMGTLFDGARLRGAYWPRAISVNQPAFQSR